MDKGTLSKSHTYRQHTGCGRIYVTLADDKVIVHRRDDPPENAGCAEAWFGAMTTMVEICKQAGIGSKEIAKALRGPSCDRAVFDADNPGKKVVSCGDALAKVIEKVWK